MLYYDLSNEDLTKKLVFFPDLLVDLIMLNLDQSLRGYGLLKT